MTIAGYVVPIVATVSLVLNVQQCARAQEHGDRIWMGVHAVLALGSLAALVASAVQ